ncbi:MAG: hypothetical protein JST26_07635 [Bacteroidetes bacterium]|nr:hypothetical protein [Bacteroidota bacterium]
MKNRFFLLFIFITILCRAQDPNKFWQGWNSEYGSIDIHGGVYMPDLGPMNRYFRDKRISTLPAALNTIGGGVKSKIQTNFPAFHECHTSFQYFIPTNIQSDSLRFSLSGFNAGFDFGKDLLYKSKKLDLLVCIGFKGGRLKLMREDQLSHAKSYYTNPYLAPLILIEPKAILGPLCISLKAEYLFDISKTGWKHKSKNMPDIPYSRFTGALLQLSLGYAIPYESRTATVTESNDY